MVEISEEKIIIPTYPEPPAEEMPMFAENRVHQRTSGNPYPNHVVLETDRTHKEDKEYTLIRLENKYIRLEILPELGGRIYSAYDKITGYDFFYKQHVIKPALIGCLGSWISGGAEFNWPFHHRASTFMPTDYYIEKKENGGAIVWLSEHDPIERMKGMVGISLNPNEAIFETKVRLFNRTDETHSFLWWENTAVPVNKNYRIFFPKDVSYVNFHYKRSVTTFPTADNSLGIFNGIRYDGETDISMHRNTIQPTSYFSAPSKYDFFGGFDCGKKCGVVHIANHHISPGKKMFTWGYNGLSKSWQNALTDTDGPYAELMAGCYSDNQPDFAWIEPYETKIFSQYWFPIGNLGTPCFANTNGAIHWDSENLIIQATKNINAKIVVTYGNLTIFKKTALLYAGKPSSFEIGLKAVGYTVSVSENGKNLLKYTEEKADIYNIPDTAEDMPDYKKNISADELYLEGVHVKQYRDPIVSADRYWHEAIRRNTGHVNSLCALAQFYLSACDFEKAKRYSAEAEKALTKYNKHPESGKLYYIIGKIYLAENKTDKAYDYFYKSSWNMDTYSAAMTQIAAIDGQRGNYEEMLFHSENALSHNINNGIAACYRIIALNRLGNDCTAEINKLLKCDRLNHFARYLSNDKNFYDNLSSNMSQTCLDIAFDLTACGEYELAKKLLENLPEKEPMVYYFLNRFEEAESIALKCSFPFRCEEYKLLKKITAENPDLPMAHYYLGCLLYSKKQYENAACEFEKTIELKPDFYIPYRNIAALNYSHLNKNYDVLAKLKKALTLNPDSSQLVFETAYVMCKLGISPDERISFIETHKKSLSRDDICIELARAYNQKGAYESALKVLSGHTFVPCEGGEHAVAEQYMLACLAVGRELMKKGDYKNAAKSFEKALKLPKNLGAGIWNECKYVPYRFYLAECYEKTGQPKKAKKIYNWILCLEIDYFSNMHLPELPYYKAEVYKKCGNFLAGRALIDKYQKKWKENINVTDPGYFTSTPFFISYCDNPSNARKAYYSYLLGFAYKFMEQPEKSCSMFKIAAEYDKINIFYYFEAKNNLL